MLWELIFGCSWAIFVVSVIIRMHPNFLNHLWPTSFLFSHLTEFCSLLILSLYALGRKFYVDRDVHFAPPPQSHVPLPSSGQGGFPPRIANDDLGTFFAFVEDNTLK
jgi:hypothetical protein